MCSVEMTFYNFMGQGRLPVNGLWNGLEDVLGLHSRDIVTRADMLLMPEEDAKGGCKGF